ncbi:hypothetical protein U1Q18_008365 [Sarracenia purpurea var. burkii]
MYLPSFFSLFVGIIDQTAHRTTTQKVGGGAPSTKWPRILSHGEKEGSGSSETTHPTPKTPCLPNPTIPPKRELICPVIRMMGGTQLGSPQVKNWSCMS